MTPILLGKHPELDHWFFFGEKGGVGRFIRYYVCKNDQYAQWASAEQLPGILDITSRPSIDIIKEVDRFSKGFVSYEIIPKTRGRSERVIRTEHSGNPLENKTNEHVLSNSTNVERNDSSIKAGRRARVKPNVSERAAEPKIVGNGKSLKKDISDTVKIRIKKKDSKEVTNQSNSNVKETSLKKSKSTINKESKSKLKLEIKEQTEVENKPKRKRRTKAEMEAFRESISNTTPLKEKKSRIKSR